MPDNLIDQARVDRRAFAVTSFAKAERAYRSGFWHSPAVIFENNFIYKSLSNWG
jgi:hypothetical protein